MVKLISDLGLCISYDTIIKIENSIANSVTQRMNENNRVRIPCNIVSGVPIHFPIDNCDFKDGTLDGKKELHDTAQVAIQKSASNTSFLIKIDRSATKFKDDFLSAKPIPRNESFSAFSGKSRVTNRRATTS